MKKEAMNLEKSKEEYMYIGRGYKKIWREEREGELIQLYYNLKKFFQMKKESYKLFARNNCKW